MKHTLNLMLSAVSDDFIAYHRCQLIAEAERERLASLLPQRPGLRHDLALACYRLADWLDPSQPARYVQPVQPGPEDWVAHAPSV